MTDALKMPARADLTGQCWFITGASSGLGWAIARQVLARGGRVVATARRAEALQELVAAAPDRVLAERLDVVEAEDIVRAVDAARRRFGNIDTLVNNAGYALVAGQEEAADAEVRAMFDVNVLGLAAMTRAVLPAMRARRAGTIINISSMVGFRASPGMGYYSATKWAVEALSESLAQEVRPLGLQVMIVEPGPVRTDFSGRSLVVPARPIPAYENVTAMRTMSAGMDGKQPGDPERCAALIVDTAAGDKPPLRLVLGAMGYRSICDAIAGRLETVRASADIAAAADFPAA